MAHTVDIAESNGQRLARLRKRHRWTQQRLALESGYSLSAIRHFEQGLRSLDRAAVVLAFAQALDCHPTEITGAPYVPAQADRDGQTAVASVAAVRRSLMRHGRPARPTDAEAAAVDLADLRRRVAEANGFRQAAALTQSGIGLPGLLRDLQVAAELTTGDERRIVFGLLASGYECAMQYLYKLGHSSDATLATERVVWASRETGDPLRVLAASWYDAGEFLTIGEHDEAGAIIDGALTELGTIPSPGPATVSLKGAFHLKASLNLARAKDSAAAVRHLGHAQQAAAELGEDRNDWQLQFGPTNAALWSVSLPVELGRGKDAVTCAEKIRLPADYSRERRSHFYIDFGRAYFYNGQRDEALRAFLNAEKLAPQATRAHAGVRETVGTMIRTKRRGELMELGIRLGVV
ncbi:helix-turn-helix transcriptional regulator [Streptomyces phaeolivaceus]|uniref:Helix-turn-helix transcriptional regulator n=1 Tax=Streptomyces phaeolivaceus TaxID=2653200 RepID=A0A5P8K2Y7_9ACTN|nr:helix-turn-helix transcriptional regulator [Streptomyces phaeolivaceus]QFQ96987.1 helix-turn-helix transcriptional regulator [Streptomyces phaeolivaceus]